jgi:hypothetical protein
VVLLLKIKGLAAFSGCFTRRRVARSAAAMKMGVQTIALHAVLRPRHSPWAIKKAKSKILVVYTNYAIFLCNF